MIQLVVSISLCVLIWVIQVLHYPFFRFIDDDKFLEGMKFHQRRISYLVMPLMLAEGFTSIYEAVKGGPFNYLLLAIVIAIWVHTFLVMVPLHNLLVLKKDLKVIKKLVNSNWIRTALWSVKALLVTWAWP